MNKAEFIAAVSEKANISKVDAGKAYDAVVSTIIDELKAGQPVQVSGLGIFKVKDRAARAGVNPKTGAKIEIAATKAIGFKAAKAASDAIK